MVSQVSAHRRDREARLWTRRADAYVALMRWRLSPPDDVAIANPRLLAEAQQEWEESAYPLLAELSLFGGPDLQAVLRENKHLFGAAERLGALSTGELAALVQRDLASHPPLGRFRWFPPRRSQNLASGRPQSLRDP